MLFQPGTPVSPHLRPRCVPRPGGVLSVSWSPLRGTADLLLTIGIHSKRQPGISAKGQVRRSTTARLGRFGTVHAGCGLPNSSQPVTEEELMPDPGFTRPDLCSIRAAAQQAEHTGTVRGGRGSPRVRPPRTRPSPPAGSMTMRRLRPTLATTRRWPRTGSACRPATRCRNDGSPRCSDAHPAAGREPESPMHDRNGRSQTRRAPQSRCGKGRRAPRMLAVSRSNPRA